MERKRKLIQVYAIIVNIVAIIAFLIASTTFVSALISRGAPLYSDRVWQAQDLSSFEKYKLDILKSTKEDDAYIPNDEMIREMFDSAIEEKINRVMHNTWKDMIVSGLIIIISVFLFVFHWLVMKKYDRLE